MNVGRSAFVAACVLFTALCSVPFHAQAVATTPAIAAPTFEVATIKPTEPMHRNRGFHVSGNRVNIENQDVTTLIVIGYSVHPKQIVNAPDWFDTARWTIDGVADKEGKLSVADVQVMVQKLLADRFGLKFKREQREIPVYALTVAKGGPKLETSKADPNALPNQNGNGKGRMQFQNTTMTTFLLGMQSEFDRPLVDQTGLDGHYDFSLRWTPDTAPAGDADAPPGMFTAIQEQLGLKVSPVKAPANVLVIESAEKPSAN
ncbi:TIGR03435 family protein [Terriglobus sp. TAA 43]|uniref:TIGR03435 family protein n=1 Tax=Terriglobus sp. TAA 43 TaxID=278961 RepID=UPI00068FFFD2|nr:TIGR03435 family protein [Terriglobus sp. TAA 43]